METSPIYSIEVRNIDHEPVLLESYRGKVLLVVNVASRCGFTRQYEGLERLYRANKGAGFELLAFPCNQFGAQEPGDENEIREFCRANFSVSFPMFEKIEVNGEGAHPLYQFLKSAAPGILGTEAIKWNFTKFLIDRRGNVVERFAPSTSPDALQESLHACLTERDAGS